MLYVHIWPFPTPPIKYKFLWVALSSLPTSAVNAEHQHASPVLRSDGLRHPRPAVLMLPSTSRGLDLPSSELEQHLSESLQRRNQNIREKMIVFEEVCRDIGYSPSQIDKNNGIIAGQLYLPSPVTSTQRSLNRQSSSSSASRPQEPNSEQNKDQT